MSTNLEYRERERKRKRESRQQASEAQQEKEWEIKDKGDIFLLEFCSGGKIRNASGYQGAWKWAAVKKKWTRTRVIFPPWMSNQEVSWSFTL